MMYWMNCAHWNKNGMIFDKKQILKKTNLKIYTRTGHFVERIVKEDK